MHIPDGMLSGQVCGVSLLVGGLSVAGAFAAAWKSKEKPSVMKFGAVTGMVFALQMMNFQVQDGTSGHLLGGVLAASALGLPFGMLSIALVLLVQALFFADGGVFVFGANVLNMAVIGVGVYAGACFLKPKNKVQKYGVTALFAWASVCAASFACTIELALSDSVSFDAAFSSMMSVHALIGIGEAVLSVVVLALFFSEAKEKGRMWIPTAGSFAIAGLLSPYASGFPDGLEWVGEKLGFLSESQVLISSPFPDYTVALFSNEALSVGAAGVVGVLIVFAISYLSKGCALIGGVNS